MLTGGTGFLGAVLLQYLSKDFEVHSLGRSEQNTICADLSVTIPALNQVYDIIVHNAGKAHVVPKTLKEKEAFFKVNQLGTEHLLSALSRLEKPPESFIFISTIAVYGQEEGEEITEAHPLEGSSPYALSKIKAEEAITKWCTNQQVACCLLRLPLIVGPQPPGNLGAITKAIKTGRYFKIAGNEARKSAVLAEDVAKLLPKLLDKSGTYNLTDGLHPKFSDIEAAFEEALNKKVRLRLPLLALRLVAFGGDLLQALKIPFPLHSLRLKKMTATLTFSDEKAKAELGWAPKSVLQYIEQGKTL